MQFTERKISCHNKEVPFTDYMFLYFHLNYSEILATRQIITESKVSGNCKTENF